LDSVSISVSEEIAGFEFEGHVDFYGHSILAGGWFFGGWIAYPWPLGHRPQNAVAVFAELSVEEHTHSTFYNRDDVSGRGIGFVFFLQSSQAQSGVLLHMRIECAGTDHSFDPTPDVLRLTDTQLVEHLRDLLADADNGSQRQEMQNLLFGKQEPKIAGGFIDFYGHHTLAGGWFFCGWITLGWGVGHPPDRSVVTFDEGDVDGETFAVLHPRHNLHDGAEGIVFFVRGAAKPLGRLRSVSFEAFDVRAVLKTADTAPRLRELELGTQLRPVIGQALPTHHRDILLGLLGRVPYHDEDTLAALGSEIFIEIDEAILTVFDSLVLMGWCLARPTEIHDIRLRCGPLSSSLELEHCLRVERPDVIASFIQNGFDDPRCGFIAFLPHSVVPDSPIYLEVETASRELGYRKVPRPRLDGIAAIKRVLSAVDVRFTQVRSAFDHVLGPAIEGLNRSRLAKRPKADVIDYGQIPASPRFSVIIPLYGRLDFVEYQLALFSTNRDCAEVEFIYVLDEPPRLREAQLLFASVFERFLVPFKAVLLDRNVGFAPASNIGLAEARGRFIAFMNSDVFPGTLDWLERLSSHLADDPSIGVIGPVLLFEDGSVQHRGMFFGRLAEFGSWFFPVHHDKGRRLVSDGSLQSHLSITGACMLMTRSLANELGGFDETYAVGDFEDTDLCLKLQARGYRCVVDPTVQLFHLERKSQASSALGWRLNLTVYNAWQHDRRWGATIAALQGA
jgi:GT2 family glycosyltransferase